MIRCPVCTSGESMVIDTRSKVQGEIFRRRSCNECGSTFSTKEVLIRLIHDNTIVKVKRVPRVKKVALPKQAPKKKKDPVGREELDSDAERWFSDDENYLPEG